MRSRDRELLDQFRIGSACLKRSVTVARKRTDGLLVPRLRQDLAGQHQIDRAGRLALHDGVGAPQDFLADDARWQRVFPLDVRPHEAALIERLLDEVHVGVARPFELAEAGERGRSRYQQNRNAVAE